VLIAHGNSDRGTQKRGSTFTGEVWYDPIIQPEGVGMATVVFTPGARTYWHSHQFGQILEVTAGRGWVCSEDGEPIMIRSGDTVWTPPAERHWHGASAESFLSHRAISLGGITWLEEVGQAVYDAAHAHLGTAGS
jgi:quercetin dioxygenase-like cupin family protein